MLGVLDGRHDGYFQKGDTAVTWAFGHILTQAAPDAYGEEFADFGNIEALPVLPDIWKMEVPSKVAKQFKVIKGLLANAAEVVIATDADREGEVIAREILDYCGYRKKVSRFWTSGLDTQSVKKALATIMPGQKTENLYQAGLARGRADWLVGMNLSRAYTVAYAAGYGREHTLSIGRIQTPTLKLVVQRDATIDNFVPYNYYTKTSPPPRFTESSLLDEMQTLKDFLRDVEDEQIRKILKSTEGLGTEATRAAIIDRLFEMGYMEKKRGKIYSTEKGRNLIARVPAIIADPITTAKWELALAGIEAGKLTLADFMAYQQKVITELVEQAKKDAAGKPRPPKQSDSASTKKQAVARNEDDICPTCKEGRLKQRGFKENPDKRYWGCSRFPECKHFEWVK